MFITIDDVRNHLATAVKRQGFNQWMAPEIIVAEADRLELEMPIRAEMTQHHGFVHGGCVAAFADTAAAWSAWSAALACCKDVVTSNYSVQLLAPAQGVKLRASAEPVKVGRSLATIDVKVFSVDDEDQVKICAAVLAGISILGNRKKQARRVGRKVRLEFFEPGSWSWMVELHVWAKQLLIPETFEG